MKRRQFISAIGGGVFTGTAVGSARRGPPSRSGPTGDRYTGPMISAHEHLLFMPDGGLDFLVEWMDANDWKRLVAFSTPELLDRYGDYPSRFIPFNQAPFSRYALPKIVGDVDPNSLPPYLPFHDEPPTLEELPGEFDASLQSNRSWQGIGEISFQLVHLIEGDSAVSRPDAEWAMDLYGVAADHNVTVMLHPPHPSQWDEDAPENPLDHAIVNGLRRVFDAFPRMQFLVHGFSRNLLEAVNPLLEDHNNWVYDVSGIMFGHSGFWTPPGLTEEEVRQKRDWLGEHMTEEHIEQHIDEEFARWEDILREHPDRVLWGIDSGRPWHFYERYFNVHDRFYRGLLGRLPHADATKIAHLNARRFLHP